MSSPDPQAVINSAKASNQSACSFEAIDVSGGDYEPSRPFKGIYVGGTGDIAIAGLNGRVVVFTNLAAGIAHPFAGIKVMETGTDATALVALF